MYFKIENENNINYEKLEKFLNEKFLYKRKNDIYFKLRYENIKEMKKDIKLFIIDLKLNLKNKDYEKIINFYNYLNLLEIYSIKIKRNKYYEIRYNLKTNRKKQYEIKFNEILENLINFQITNNIKRFNIKYRFKKDNIKNRNEKYYKDYEKFKINENLKFKEKYYYIRNINYEKNKKIKKYYKLKFSNKNYETFYNKNLKDLKKIENNYYKKYVRS